MKKALALSVLAFATAAPAGAQPTGMAAMQYYVGTWSCVGTQTGQAPSNATLHYWLDDGFLRQWVQVPMQGKMKAAYALNSGTVYDSKNNRYVSSGLDTDLGWSVSYGTLSGNTEHWTDHLNSTGKNGRGEIVRSDQNSFVFTSWDTTTATKPSFKATCHRST